LALCMSCAFGQAPLPPNLPVKAPVALKKFKPDCSKGHSCHGLRGEAVVTVLVKEDGTVGETTLKEPSGDKAMDDAAVEAAKLWTFTPGTFLAKPKAMSFDIHFNF